MKNVLNKKVKHREWYRPFAPMVLQHEASEYFVWDNSDAPYMSFSAHVRSKYQEQLASVTHVDYSARIQTINRKNNAWYYTLLNDMKQTGLPVLLNTSFNIKGNPIINTIKDAFYINLGLNFEAYTMNWKDSDKPRYNQDSEAAKLICKKLGIKFNSVEMPPLNTLDDQLSKYINAIGEPNSNPSGISMMSLYDQISKDKIRLVLTGDGSDEIFGGYERYKILDRFSRVPSIPSNIISDIILFNSSKFKISSKLAAIMSAPSNSSSWYFWHQLADNLYLKKFYEDFCFKNC
jgi:hypothetical protein